MKKIITIFLTPALLFICTMAFAQQDHAFAPIKGDLYVDNSNNEVNLDFGLKFLSINLDPAETYTLNWDMSFLLDGMPGYTANCSFDPSCSNIEVNSTPSIAGLEDRITGNIFTITADGINEVEHTDPEPNNPFVDLAADCHGNGEEGGEGGPNQNIHVTVENITLVDGGGVTVTVPNFTLSVEIPASSSKQQLLSTTTGALVNPNPIVTSAVVTEDVSSIDVLDLQGKVWFSSKTDGANQSINLSHLPAGMYIMRVQTAEGIRQEMIFKE